MHPIKPRHIIIPSILISAFAIFCLSRSVYGFSRKLSQENIEDHLHSSNSILIHEKYPLSIQQWNSEIINYSESFNVDPNLIAAVILIESGGQPEIISSSGAVGLMQIMPRDGIAANFICPNGPCFINRPTISQLKNPDFNIKYGTRMLSKLIESTGSLRSALYAYGPMDVGYSYSDQVLSIFRSY